MPSSFDIKRVTSRLASRALLSVYERLPDAGVNSLITPYPTSTNEPLKSEAVAPGPLGEGVGNMGYSHPDGSLKTTPRTQGVPGEEYGVPVNDSAADGGTLAPRTMTSMDKEAWRRTWQSGKRRHHLHGQARAKSRAYYRRNKSKIRAKARIRRNRLRHSGAFKASERLRRRQNRHMISSLVERVTPETLTAMYLYEKLGAKFAPVNERGGVDGQKQRHQTPEQKRQDHRDYLRGRGQKKRDAIRYYKQKCKPNSRCMDRREKLKEDPEKYERAAPRVTSASVLTVPDIAFAMMPNLKLGYVHTISPMTGMVTFFMPEPGATEFRSLPVEVFMRSAVFLTDEDLDAFFELVDAELGPEAYENLDEESVAECARLYGMDPYSDEFFSKCRDHTGLMALDHMTADQLEYLEENLFFEVFEGSEDPRDLVDFEDLEEEDEDDDLLYGEPLYSDDDTEDLS